MHYLGHFLPRYNLNFPCSLTEFQKFDSCALLLLKLFYLPCLFLEQNMK